MVSNMASMGAGDMRGIAGSIDQDRIGADGVAAWPGILGEQFGQVLAVEYEAIGGRRSGKCAGKPEFEIHRINIADDRDRITHLEVVFFGEVLGHAAGGAAMNKIGLLFRVTMRRSSWILKI